MLLFILSAVANRDGDSKVAMKCFVSVQLLLCIDFSIKDPQQFHFYSFFQLFSALKNAFSVILKFLDFLATQVLSKEPNRLEDFDLKHFVCATIRVLGAWLSEETATMREEVLLNTNQPRITYPKPSV